MRYPLIFSISENTSVRFEPVNACGNQFVGIEDRVVL